MDRAPVLVVALLLLGLSAAAIQNDPAAPPDAVSHAAAYLQDQPMTPEVVEALVATGTHPDTRTLHLPAPDPDAPANGLRTLHALLLTGKPTHDDPERGTVHLAQELQERRELVLGAPSAATLGFWLLSARILELPAAPELDALLALQAPDGGFPCAGGFRSLDCTGFAVAALAAHDALPRADLGRLEASLRSHKDPGGGYTDGHVGPNAQSTAWALASLRHLGADDPEAEAWLLGLQRPDGHFARSPHGPDPTPWWATAEVVVALRGGHPVQPLPEVRALAASAQS